MIKLKKLLKENFNNLPDALKGVVATDKEFDAMNANAKRNFYCCLNIDKKYKKNGQPSYILLPNDVIENLLDFTRDNGKDIKRKFFPYLEKVKLNEPMVLYRGLTYRKNYRRIKKHFHKKLQYIFSKYKVGQEITISNDRASSWTKSKETASTFATQLEYGITLKYTAMPDEVLIDLTLFDNFGEYSEQKEVILKPGKNKCEIVYLNKDQVADYSLLDDKYD